MGRVATVIIGVGNPVLTDDGVGLRIARELRQRLHGRDDVAVLERCAGGLRLMEAMTGYGRAIVIDAIESGAAAGSIHEFDAAALPVTRNLHSSHDGSLAAALEFGRAAGLGVPEEIRVWAVEAGDVETFGESLTAPVERAVSRVVDAVLRSLPV
jgi:hydrogenase maturation protease